MNKNKYRFYYHVYYFKLVRNQLCKNSLVLIVRKGLIITVLYNINFIERRNIVYILFFVMQNILMSWYKKKMFSSIIILLTSSINQGSIKIHSYSTSVKLENLLINSIILNNNMS